MPIRVLTGRTITAPTAGALHIMDTARTTTDFMATVFTMAFTVRGSIPTAFTGFTVVDTMAVDFAAAIMAMAATVAAGSDRASAVAMDSVQVAIFTVVAGFMVGAALQAVVALMAVAELGAAAADLMVVIPAAIGRASGF